MNYGLKTVHELHRVLMHMLFGFSRNNCVGMADIVRPHLDYRIAGNFGGH